MWPKDCHAPYFKYHPSQRVSESEEDEEAPEEFNFEDPPELKPEVDCFLWWPVESSEEENVKNALPQTSHRRIGEVGDLEGSDI